MDYLKWLENKALTIPVMASTPTVYLMDIDGEATVVIAENIADAMDKAEKIAKVDYAMVYHKSLPLLY